MDHSASFAPLAEGAIFARDFRIVRPLSQGGMGAVYVAVQISTGRERALKLMHPRLVQDERQRRRFEQEAQVGARVESAHVVEVVAAGVDDESGAPWLCMELLRGRDLAALAAERGAMPPADVLFVFRQICHAVAAAHRVGVVHRDLKPENVFLATSRQADAPYVVKVLDFGIAKLVADGDKTDTAAIGTPLWMAPEQTEAGAAIGPPTDVWALGLIAFRLLTGRPYWKGASDENASAVTLLREIAIAPLEGATARAAALGGVAPPPGFDAWFGRCVVREPAERFANAAEALDALVPILGGDRASGAPLLPQPEVAPDADGRAPSLGGVSSTQDPERRSVPARISGLEATEPAALPPLAPTQLDDAPRSEHPPSTAAPKPPPNRFFVVVGALAIVIGLGAVINWQWRLASERDAQRAREAAEQKKNEEEAARAATDDKVKLAERRALLDATLGKMARVPATTFALGSDDHDNDEKPVTKVAVPAFEIDLREASMISYAACVKSGKCPPAGTGDGCNATKPERAADPINCVDAAQAEAFCRWAGKRLPREEEWELAARGVEERLYPWGPALPTEEDACWKRGDPAKPLGTCKVGERGPPSAFGLVDVAGNVKEWTASGYCPYSRRDCEAASRAVRGGAWTDAEPDALRTTVRSKFAPDTRSPAIGFRCARDALY